MISFFKFLIFLSLVFPLISCKEKKHFYKDQEIDVSSQNKSETDDKDDFKIYEVDKAKFNSYLKSNTGETFMQCYVNGKKQGYRLVQKGIVKNLYVEKFSMWEKVPGSTKVQKIYFNQTFINIKTKKMTMCGDMSAGLYAKCINDENSIDCTIKKDGIETKTEDIKGLGIYSGKDCETYFFEGDKKSLSCKNKYFDCLLQKPKFAYYYYSKEKNGYRKILVKGKIEFHDIYDENKKINAFELWDKKSVSKLVLSCKKIDYDFRKK
jgi:hypothetical protein